MGQAGNVILFMVTLVAATILGAYVLAHMARCFLVILEQTAEGLDEVAWPRDLWTEWIGRAVHLAAVVALWLVPVGLALRLLARPAPDAAPVLGVALPALLFWLFFPFNLLSSFSADSPWKLFRGEVVRRMARRPGATAAFYLLTAPVCLVGAGVLFFALAGGWGWGLALLATLLFLYARLLGRLASILARVRLRARRPPQDEAPQEANSPAPAERDTARPRKRGKRTPEEDGVTPAADQAGEEAPPLQMVEGYGLQEEAPARPAPRPPAIPSKKPTRVRRGYGVPDEPLAEPPPEAPDEPKPPEATREPAGYERPLPTRPWLDGIWAFPWYPSNLGSWGYLTLLCLGWGLLYALAMSLLTF